MKPCKLRAMEVLNNLILCFLSLISTPIYCLMPKTQHDIAATNMDNLFLERVLRTTSDEHCSVKCKYARLKSAYQKRVQRFSKKSGLCQCFWTESDHLTDFKSSEKFQDVIFTYDSMND